MNQRISHLIWQSRFRKIFQSMITEGPFRPEYPLKVSIPVRVLAPILVANSFRAAVQSRSPPHTASSLRLPPSLAHRVSFPLN